MTCIDARDMFSLLADDALTPLERAALDAHLADCAECRRELAGFERTVKLVRAIDPAHAPAGFVERVLAAAQSNRPAPAPAPQPPVSKPPQPAPAPQPPVSKPPQPTPAPQQPTPLRERPTPVPERPARRARWPMLPLGAAALLVVGGLAVLLFRSSPEQQRAAQRQLESPPPVTAPAPPTEAPPAPAPPSREPPKPAAPASKPPKTAAKPPAGAGKRAETSVAERKSLPDEQRNVAPSQTAERSDTKLESAERAQDKDKRDTAQEPLAKRRADAPPSVAQDAIQPAPASPSRDRQAAVAKGQPTPQTSPLSRTGPMTGIPAVPPDVTARLRVADVKAGEQSLIALAARAGGRQTGRRIDAGRIVVELAVPRDAYPQFVRDATALGSMSIDRQATDAPMLAVAVTLSH
jgi:putative zinc finger protein